jgi:uncharacterized protein (TIGR02452 family)
MASIFKPGGGVRTGKTAQEEVIFRRTNAFLTQYKKWYHPKGNGQFDGLNECDVIYAPEVHIVRNPDDTLLTGPGTKFATLVVPAVRKPKLTNRRTDYRHERDYDVMYAKIESIFQMALLHGHDTLVLGALGCGAYGNPLGIIIDIFKGHMATYAKYFKKIAFAILVTGDRDTSNLDRFRDEFVPTAASSSQSSSQRYILGLPPRSRS